MTRFPGIVVVGLAATAVLATAVAGSTASPSGHLRGPWLLVSLPSLGTVTWRCDARRERSGRPALALGIDGSSATATQDVALAAGGARVVRTQMQPGQVVALPFLGHAVQTLTLVQRTKPGTLRATVRVDLGPRPISPSHCWEHLPPAVVARVFPR